VKIKRELNVFIEMNMGIYVILKELYIITVNTSMNMERSYLKTFYNRRIEMEFKKEKCYWKNEDEYYSTQCDNAFSFNDGGPQENGFEYCPYCAGRIIVEQPQQENRQ
jgi:hypothetical protein